MLVTTEYPGRLGNVLFQYCLGRILASKLHCNLQAQEILGFKNAVSVRNTWWPTITHRTEVLNGQAVHFDRIMKNKKDRRILLKGHFQRYEYYKEYKEAIRKDWLYLPDSGAFAEEDITIHIRSGDLWAKNRPDPPNDGQRPPPFSYYEKILTSRPWGKVHVVTENKDDPMALKLANRFSGTLHHGSVIEDFQFLKSSPNMILSVSTFAWWAGWLSNAKRIYFPMCGFWHPQFYAEDPTNLGINLIVDDEDRYIYQELDKSGRWKGAEEDRIALLNS